MVPFHFFFKISGDADSTGCVQGNQHSDRRSRSLHPHVTKLSLR